MPNITPEEQQIKDMKDNLTRLSSATAENIIDAITTFLSLLEDSKNNSIINNRYLYPYFAALIEKHSAILKRLGLIDEQLVFQGGTTPLKQLMGIYTLALFTFKKAQQEPSLKNYLNDYSFAAQHGNLQAATALISYYSRELPKMSEVNFESFVRMVNGSVFSHPTALRASGFFLSAQLYYQISQNYLQKEKDNTGNPFKYFQKAILHYITARHLLRAGLGQQSMPLVVTEKIYPSVEDEEEFIRYITEKVLLFKDESTVLLDSNAVARQACLNAESCVHEYSARIDAANPLNVEELDQAIQKALSDSKRVLTSYSGVYFTPARNGAQVVPSNAAAEGPSFCNGL